MIGKKRVKHLFFAGVVTLPPCRSFLPHGEIEFEGQLCLPIFVRGALEGRSGDAGQIIEEYNRSGIPVQYRRMPPVFFCAMSLTSSSAFFRNIS